MKRVALFVVGLVCGLGLGLAIKDRRPAQSAPARDWHQDVTVTRLKGGVSDHHVYRVHSVSIDLQVQPGQYPPPNPEDTCVIHIPGQGVMLGVHEVKPE